MSQFPVLVKHMYIGQSIRVFQMISSAFFCIKNAVTYSINNFEELQLIIGWIVSISLGLSVFLITFLIWGYWKTCLHAPTPPAQEFVLHSLFSVKPPVQLLPAPVQFRSRDCVPPPHVTEQFDHELHSVSTPVENTKISNVCIFK